MTGTPGPDSGIRKLKNSRQFQVVYSQGKKSHSRSLIVFYLECPASRLRWGVTVTKRIGCAVVRNRAKRIIREAMRHLEPLIHPNYDIVIVAKESVTSAGTAQMIDELKHLFIKNGLIRPDAA